eukprot:gene17391-22180_t
MTGAGTAIGSALIRNSAYRRVVVGSHYAAFSFGGGYLIKDGGFNAPTTQPSIAPTRNPSVLPSGHSTVSSRPSTALPPQPPSSPSCRPSSPTFTPSRLPSAPP